MKYASSVSLGALRPRELPPRDQRPPSPSSHEHARSPPCASGRARSSRLPPSADVGEHLRRAGRQRGEQQRRAAARARGRPRSSRSPTGPRARAGCRRSSAKPLRSSSASSARHRARAPARGGARRPGTARSENWTRRTAAPPPGRARVPSRGAEHEPGRARDDRPRQTDVEPPRTATATRSGRDAAEVVAPARATSAGGGREPVSRAATSGTAPREHRAAASRAAITRRSRSDGRRQAQALSRQPARCLRRIDHICDARSSSSAAGHGSAGGPSSVRSERAVRRASSGSAPRHARPAPPRAPSTSSSSTAAQARPSSAARAPSMPLAEERHRRRRLALPGAPEQHAVAAARDAARSGRKPEIIFASRDHDRRSVAKARFTPGPDRPAAHRGDRWAARARPTRANERYTSPSPLNASGAAGSAPASASVVAVAAGAEVAAGALDDDRADAGVGVDLLARGHQLRAIARVSALRRRRRRA